MINLLSNVICELDDIIQTVKAQKPGTYKRQLLPPPTPFAKLP